MHINKLMISITSSNQGLERCELIRLAVIYLMSSKSLSNSMQKKKLEKCDHQSSHMTGVHSGIHGVQVLAEIFAQINDITKDIVRLHHIDSFPTKFI